MALQPKTVQVQRIPAIRLTVTSAEQAKNFYTQAFGCETVSDVIVGGQDYSDLERVTNPKIRVVTLQLGNEHIRLVEYLNTKARPIPTDSQSNDLWFQHIAIVVSDMDHAYKQLQSFPIEPISTKPQTIPPDNKASAGVRAFKFKDPDRHNLELIWFPPDKGEHKWHQNSDRLFLGIDHSAIAVANTQDSLKFYHDFLGMEVKQGSLNHGETQAHLDGLAEAKVQVTPLRPTQPSLGIELLDYIAPANGRPIPSDWKSSDITNVQLELVVNDIQQVVDLLQENNVEVVSSRIVQFTDKLFPYRQGCLIKDVNGHALLLVEE